MTQQTIDLPARPENWASWLLKGLTDYVDEPLKKSFDAVRITDADILIVRMVDPRSGTVYQDIVEGVYNKLMEPGRSLFRQGLVLAVAQVGNQQPMSENQGLFAHLLFLARYIKEHGVVAVLSQLERSRLFGKNKQALHDAYEAVLSLSQVGDAPLLLALTSAAGVDPNIVLMFQLAKIDPDRFDYYMDEFGATIYSHVREWTAGLRTLNATSLRRHIGDERLAELASSRKEHWEWLLEKTA